MDTYEKILEALAPKLSWALGGISPDRQKSLEEIRIRNGKALSVTMAKGLFFVSPKGELLKKPQGALTVTQEAVRTTFDRITESSVYAVQDQLRQGFLTLFGGHRVGVTGTAVVQGGVVTTLKDISGLNIRIAKEIIGAARGLSPYVIEKGQVRNTLVLSPPGYGKTTVLRDMARILSDEYGKKVCIADERGEIAAMHHGQSSFCVGEHTDVLDRCPKNEGIPMLLRTMSPEVMITDEIGGEGDLKALLDARTSGVSVIASAHGGSVSELYQRPMMAELLRENLIDVFVILSKEHGKFWVEERR